LCVAATNDHIGTADPDMQRTKKGTPTHQTQGVPGPETHRGQPVMQGVLGVDRDDGRFFARDKRG